MPQAFSDKRHVDAQEQGVRPAAELRNISVVGAAWGAWLAGDPSLFAQTAAALAPMIEAGRISPPVGASFPLDQAPAALRLIDERRAVGKVVLTV